MTQEEKQLLLIDLCARLPYGVIVHNEEGYEGHLNSINQTIFGIELGVNISATRCVDFQLDTCKPYLRPLSSMTKEERRTLLKYGSIGMDENDKVFDVYTYGIKKNVAVIDYLNAYHFDYRGLIPMGLALEAPEGMYK